MIAIPWPWDESLCGDCENPQANGLETEDRSGWQPVGPTDSRPPSDLAYRKSVIGVNEARDVAKRSVPVSAANEGIDRESYS